MRKAFALAVVAIAATIGAPPAFGERRCDFPQGVVCDGQFLSWVTVTFFNDATEDALDRDPSAYTSKVRAYLRRELPELEHEVVDPYDRSDGLVPLLALDKAEAREKVMARCMIAVSRSGPSMGIYVECGLLTFLDARTGRKLEIEGGAIGAGTNVRDYDGFAEDILRDVAQQVSDGFYGKLSRYESASSGE